MPNDPMPDNAATPENDNTRSTDILSPPLASSSISPEPEETPPSSAIAAGPASQVVNTPESPATTPEPPPAAPGEEIIGSWLGAHLYRADRAYVVLVLLLSFLLGSFAAANTDLWMHLATGRMLQAGKYTFGVDPFSYTTGASKATDDQPEVPAVPWINHSWLYSWIMYGLYSLHEQSGIAPVLFKALCIVALAAILLLIRPRNRFGWAGTAGVLLIMVVASSAFTLQPIVISLLFLAVTLLVLVRAGVLAEKDEGGRMKDEQEKTLASSFILHPSSFPRLLWLLPPLFALWINLDAWFLLGPLVLSACVIVLAVEHWMGRKTRVCPKMLAAVLAVGLAACLANPHHYHALFKLPPELGYLLVQTGDFWPDNLVGGGKALLEMHQLRDSPLYRLGDSRETISVLTSQYLTRSDFGWNLAGYGFFVLLALVLASFYFCRPNSSGLFWLRLLLTLVFGLLAIVLSVLVPFFAIVGGAIAILNVQEFLARREADEPSRVQEHDLWANADRLVMSFLLFGLFLLAWPGWVNHGLFDFDFTSPRRVAWHIEVDPSLKKASEFLKQMHNEKKLKRCFNLSTDLAGFCAWHAPELQFFIDRRYQLYDRVMPRYLTLRKDLVEQTDPRNPKQNTLEWEKEFARLGIDHIVGTQLPNLGSQAFRIAPIVRLLDWSWSREGYKKFDAIYLDGKTIVLAYKLAPGWISIPSVEEVWRKRVFGRHDAPWSEGLPALEEDPGDWQLYLSGQKPHPLGLYEAKWLLLYYRDVVKMEELRWRRVYINASQTLLLNPRSSLVEVVFGPLVLTQIPLPYIPGRDTPHAEAILLALKATHQSVLENPQDAEAYRLLAEGYKTLELGQENYWIGPGLIPKMRTKMRNFQYAFALNSYLILNPNDADAHWNLADFLWDQNCSDLSLEHKRKSVELMDREKKTSQEALAKKEQRKGDLKWHTELVDGFLRKLELEEFQSEIEKVERMLGTRYPLEINGQKHIVVLGFVKKALETLNEAMPKLSDEDKIQAEKLRIRLVLNITLQTGELWKLENKDTQFLEMNKDALNQVEYHTWKFFLKAALGDYRQADEQLEELEKIYAPNEFFLKMGPVIGFGNCLACNQPVLPNLYVFLDRQRLNEKLANEFYVHQAERALLRGLMAMEVGNTISARSRFNEVEDAVHKEMALRLPGTGSYFPDHKIAEKYLELMNDQE